MTTIARPFMRWPGNKHDLLDQLRPLRPRTFSAYHEPFLGAAANFWDVARTFDGPCYLSDANADLVLTYRAIRDEVEHLIAELWYLAAAPATQENYLSRRHDYNTRPDMHPVSRAAHFIFFVQTSFNSLYRVGPRGFNVGWGFCDNNAVLDADKLRACSEALRRGMVQINVADWRQSLADVNSGDYVYIDSPYAPATQTEKFTGYTAAGFSIQDQRELAAAFRGLVRSGVRVMASNSDTQLVRDLYDGFDIREVTRGGRMNCRGDRRGRVTELVIRGGYET